MPSQPLASGWNFSSVIDLIDSDTHNMAPQLRGSRSPAPESMLHDKEGGIRLGSFSQLFEDLGISTHVPDEAFPLPPLDLDSELSASSDDALPQRSLPAINSFTKSQAKLEMPTTQNDSPPAVSRAMSTSNIKSPTKPKSPAPAAPALLRAPFSEDAEAGLTKKQRRKARKQAEKEQEEYAMNSKALRDRRKLREELDALAEAAAKSKEAIQSPSKPQRARSNVGAKIISNTPVSSVTVVQKPVVMTSQPPVIEKPTAIPVQPFTTPSRPQRQTVGHKLSSTAQPVTPQRTQTAGRPALSTTFSTPAPFQSESAQGLVPRTVQPVTLPRASRPNAVARKSAPIVQRREALLAPPAPAPLAVAPPVFATPTSRPGTVTIRAQVDRHLNLFNKLLNYFPDDAKWMVAPRQLVNEKNTTEGLHVFVDVSNIMIGFRDNLRNHGIFEPYDISFDSLALLMERRRPVAKRILAGSHREANPMAHMKKLFETSKAVGYESNVIEQVYISREPSEKKKFFDDVKKMGWHKATEKHSGSGSGSDSETGAAAAATPKTPSAPKWVEQGVDELLHLKMCQSIIDCEVASTIVLATGDGNVAEMSDGFLAHVERALKKGWKVELVSWRQQTNGGYKSKKFRTKWAEQFRIIELDDFLEDLIDTP